MGSVTELHVETEEDPVVLAPEAKPKKRLSVAEQFERNQQIVSQKVRGIPWSQIAREHGISIQRCQQIFAEWRESNPTLRTHDPVEIVDELLYGYQATVEDLAVLAAKPTINDAVRVGAHNSKMKAYREMAELLQAIGALPNDLGTLRLLVDGQITAERVVTVLERFDLPEEAWDELLEALGGAPAGLLEAGDPEADGADADAQPAG